MKQLTMVLAALTLMTNPALATGPNTSELELCDGAAGDTVSWAMALGWTIRTAEVLAKTPGLDARILAYLRSKHSGLTAHEARVAALMMAKRGGKADARRIMMRQLPSALEDAQYSDHNEDSPRVDKLVTWIEVAGKAGNSKDKLNKAADRAVALTLGVYRKWYRRNSRRQTHGAVASTLYSLASALDSAGHRQRALAVLKRIKNRKKLAAVEWLGIALLEAETDKDKERALTKSARIRRGRKYRATAAARGWTQLRRFEKAAEEIRRINFLGDAIKAFEDFRAAGPPPAVLTALKTSLASEIVRDLADDGTLVESARRYKVQRLLTTARRLRSTKAIAAAFGRAMAMKLVDPAERLAVLVKLNRPTAAQKYAAEVIGHVEATICKGKYTKKRFRRLGEFLRVMKRIKVSGPDLKQVAKRCATSLPGPSRPPELFHLQWAAGDRQMALVTLVQSIGWTDISKELARMPPTPVPPAVARSLRQLPNMKCDKLRKAKP